jgi:energy-coupling factor transporter transmembrane protein EcfT
MSAALDHAGAMEAVLPRDRASFGPVLLGAMVGALVARGFRAALICAVASGVVAWLAGAPRPRAAWLRLLALGSLLSIVLNAYLIPGPGPGWSRIFGLGASAAGILAGALLALRVIGATLAVHGLRAAWPGERAADELARLLRPLERIRVPVGEVRAVLALALRFAPLVGAEARRIGALQTLRAGRPPRNLSERFARRRAAIVPTLVSALERSEQVALALEARHFRVRHEALPRWPVGSIAIGAALVLAALLVRG